MIALSFSRANLYSLCKFAFNHTHNLKTPQAESPALQGGSYFHDLSYVYGSQLGMDGSAGQDLNAAQVAVSEAPEGLSYEVYEDIRELFLKWAERTVLEFPDKMRFETKLAFNQNWEPVDFFAEDAFLRMVIDRIDFVPDPNRIVDYKTSRALQEAKSLQQKTYAFGANLALGNKQPDFLAAEEFVRFGITREKVLTYEDYKGVGGYYLKLAREIEKNTEWEPTVSSWCGLCGYPDICPKYQEEIVDTDLDVRDLAGAVKLTEKVFVDTARMKEAKKVLKVFIEGHGSVVFGDQEFGPVIEEKVSWHDLDEVVKGLRDKGVVDATIHDNLSFTLAALKKTLKSIGLKGEDQKKAVREFVQLYGEMKFGQKYTFHKAPVEEATPGKVAEGEY